MSDKTTFKLISQYDDQIINVENDVVVGRQGDCGFVLPYPSISREHAKLSVVDDQAMVEDLDSGNGTFVNDEKITRKTLASGDTVVFDQYKFKVEVKPAVKPVEEKKPEKQPEKQTEKRSEPEQKSPEPQSDVKEPENIQGDKTVNWWEKGESGPKSTAFMDPVNIASQSTNDDVSMEATDQSVLRGLNEGMENITITLQQGTMMLGRSEECDCEIDSEHVSDKHAQIVYEPPELKVISMPNTTNGTFVNGNKVSGFAFLSQGDVLGLGPVQFKVLLSGSATAKRKSGQGNRSSNKNLTYAVAGLIVIALAVAVWQFTK